MSWSAHCEAVQHPLLFLGRGFLVFGHFGRLKMTDATLCSCKDSLLRKLDLDRLI